MPVQRIWVGLCLWSRILEETCDFYLLLPRAQRLEYLFLVLKTSTAPLRRVEDCNRAVCFDKGPYFVWYCCQYCIADPRLLHSFLGVCVLVKRRLSLPIRNLWLVEWFTSHFRRWTGLVRRSNEHLKCVMRLSWWLLTFCSTVSWESLRSLDAVGMVMCRLNSTHLIRTVQSLYMIEHVVILLASIVLQRERSQFDIISVCFSPICLK